MADKSLILKNISIDVVGKNVVRDFSLRIRPGEIHALMGPNGSGKSSIAYALMGHPEYQITGGEIFLGDKNILSVQTEERARLGLFLSFQEPPEVGGVSLGTFLHIVSAKVGGVTSDSMEYFRALGLEDAFRTRFLNEGFSGGEKKKSELLQFLARKPKFAVFDEIDSGLDVDSLRAVSRILQKSAEDGAGILLISHTPRLFEQVRPRGVHVLSQGRLVASGGIEVINTLEQQGYKMYEAKNATT